MSLKGKVACDIVEALDRATAAAAGDGIAHFGAGGAAVPSLRLLRSCPNVDPATDFARWWQVPLGITIA